MSKVIMLKVGASADASLGTVFDPLPVSARKAAAQVTRELNKVSASAKAEFTKAAREQEKANAEIARSFKRRADAEVQAAAKASAEREKIIRREFDAKLREGVRARREEEREILRTAARAERVEEQSNRRIARGRRELVGRVTNEVGSLARKGVDLARTALTGMGLDLDLGSLVGKNVSLSAAATKITNSGFAAQGKQATAADVKATETAIKSSANATSTDYGAMAQALDAYNTVTGNLEESKSMLTTLGEIANASGANIVELAEAGGKLSKDLGNVPDKANRVAEALRLIAKQGALGSVEIKDLSQYMGRISSSAFMFSGGREAAIGQLGALAQVSMLGGRSSAAEAANSAARFAQQMGNENVQDNVRSVMGKDYSFYTDEGHTKMKTPETFISEFMEKTKGNQDQLAAMFKNTISKSAVEGFAAIYEDAGGGAAGMQAIHDTFEKFSKSMSKEEVTNASNLLKDTDASKMALANNQLQDAVQSLIPALQQLIPAVTSVAGFLSNHMGTAIVGAVTASIAKVALGEVLKDALKNALTPPGVPPGTTPGVPGTPGAPGETSTAGKVVAGVAAFTGGYTAGNAYTEWIDSVTNEGDNEDAMLRGRLGRASSALKPGDEGSMLELLASFAGVSDRLEIMKRATGGARDDEKIAGFQETRDDAWKQIVQTGALNADPRANQALEMFGFDPKEFAAPKGKEGGGGGEMKAAADMQNMAATMFNGAVSAFAGAVGALNAKAGGGGGGVDPAGRH